MLDFWWLCLDTYPAKNMPKMTWGTYHVLTIWKHNDQLGVMVPDHPPEILDGMEKGMLGDDEFIALIITLQNQREHRKSLGMWL